VTHRYNKTSDHIINIIDYMCMCIVLNMQSSAERKRTEQSRRRVEVSIGPVQEKRSSFLMQRFDNMSPSTTKYVYDTYFI
jgi:hypothetical protein